MPHTGSIAIAMSIPPSLFGPRISATARLRRSGLRPSYDLAMTQPEATDPRAVLAAERDRLRAEVATRIVAPDAITYGSMAAAASQVFEQQRDLALRDRNQHHLEQVEAALRRLDEGTFGACVRCGQPIAPERLEAIPWAAHCIGCQRIVGRGG
jgi:DnaK suppressor protein